MHFNVNWIDAAVAVEAAKRGLLDFGLDRDPAVALAIQRGHPKTPLLVERLDDPGAAYYLIPWLDAKGVVFVVEVDAVSGTMLGATTFPKPTPAPFLSPKKALECAARELPQHKFGKPRLVWRPCRESTSPMRPFYQISFGQDFLYVDMDSAIFRKMTPLGRGG